MRTLVISTEKPLDEAKLRLFIESMLWNGKLGEETVEVLRGKGLVLLHGSTECHSFQAVRDLYEIRSVSDGWPSGEQIGTRLLLIGRHLETKALQDALEAAAH